MTEFRSRRIDASARTQSVQVPAGTGLKELGVELEGEFIRKLSGKLQEQGLGGVDGSVVAGDSIAFKATTNLQTVQDILSQMLTSVLESAVREEFQFVDSLEPLRGSEQVSRDLDARLAAEILETSDETLDLNTHVLEFAPPDDVRFDEVDNVAVMNGGKIATMTEFGIDALRAALHEVGIRRGVGFLRGVHLLARGADDNELSQAMPLRNWLVYEAGNQTERYVLTLGRWFRLQEAYSLKLNADLRKIQDITNVLSLPATTINEHEDKYNERTALTIPGFVLMDKVPIDTEDGTIVESCDLLSRTGHLIHVKRYNGSQTLSHLFSQGAVSAELLISDSTMKDDFIHKVAGKDPSFEAVAIKTPTAVTYAIAIKDSYDLPLDLPTFSKVNLRDFAKRLRRMKVQPSLARIRVSQ